MSEIFDVEANPLVIVSDLDGTLLDHHDYSYEAVLPVLERLSNEGIPVVANTSKTAAEWLEMRQRFKNEAAFIVENGSAVFIPDGEGGFSQEVLGCRREKVLEILDKVRGDYLFEGFADWSVEKVAEKTGLDLESAKRASQRDFSEPLIWMGSEESRVAFCQEMEGHGLMTLQGGRFLHVLGKTDKGRSLEFLRSLYGKDGQCTLLALGDSPNDIAMLEAAEIGVVIASPVRDELEVQSRGRIIYSTLFGPAGWAETVTQLLDEFISQTNQKTE